MIDDIRHKAVHIALSALAMQLCGLAFMQSVIVSPLISKRVVAVLAEIWFSCTRVHIVSVPTSCIQGPLVN